jgi:hypothetical protein
MAFAALAQTSLFAGMAGVMIVFWIIGLLATVFWIWMLIDVLTSPMEATEKIIWLLVVLFLHLLGALIYFFVKRSSSRSGMATR